MKYIPQTRIKKTTRGDTETYEAQVELIYPFGFKRWINFEDSCRFFYQDHPAWEAYKEVLWYDEASKFSDLAFAKASITLYHKKMAQIVAVPVIEYIKYPD